jgi:hypothetical protein
MPWENRVGGVNAQVRTVTNGRYELRHLYWPASHAVETAGESERSDGRRLTRW